MRRVQRWWSRFRRPVIDPVTLAAGTPWVRLPVAPPLHAYGPGAMQEFHHYLAGESRIAVRDPIEVASWLLECRYADDRTFLGEPDHWQHPCTFELVRCGDCEDFSLWAWRKLVDASVDADFVVGVRRRPDGEVGRHAWVLFRSEREEYVLDGVERTLHTMIRLRGAAHEEYEPQVGVDARGRRFAFAGVFRAEWSRHLAFEPHED